MCRQVTSPWRCLFTPNGKDRWRADSLKHPPLAILLRTMSIRMYVPDLPAPSLHRWARDNDAQWDEQRERKRQEEALISLYVCNTSVLFLLMPSGKKTFLPLNLFATYNVPNFGYICQDALFRCLCVCVHGCF